MRLITFILLSFPILAFTQESVDTIIAYEHAPIDVSTIVATPGVITVYADSAYAYPSNISYYIKFFDIDSNIVFEGLEYNHYRIGNRIEYHQNGNIKVQGQYTNFVFRKNGKIKKHPKKTGKWTYYSKSGKLLRTEYLK